MAKELAFVLINPYTIGKSRTGGVIGRFIAKTGLELVSARMFGPSRELVEKYAETVRRDEDIHENQRSILADYILRAYMPDAETGRCQRVMLLLFEGEDAIERVREAAGNIRYNMTSGRTVRDIYGDYITDADGEVIYVEPAVLIGPTTKAVKDVLKLWAEYSERDGGIIDETIDLNGSTKIEKTLVLIKPDNFRFPTARPGNIIDIFSGSGLRIIGSKVHCMSVAEAEEFYGPVLDILRQKLKGMVGERSARAVSEELDLELPDSIVEQLGELIGPLYGEGQFYEIIKFMTGAWAPGLSDKEKEKAGCEKCLALVYAGEDAVNIIRGILGPTDPSKAEPGSVRKEYGESIMVNAAHASDSVENAKRELGIIKVERDAIKDWYERYYK